MVFVSNCPKSPPKPLFEPKIRISIQFWISMSNLTVICRELKMLWRNLIFDGMGMKSEMTSYSDNAYDITNCFCCFEKFLAYTLFLPSFVVVRCQIAQLNWRGVAPLPTHYMGIPTLSKIGLTRSTEQGNNKTQSRFFSRFYVSLHFSFISGSCSILCDTTTHQDNTFRRPHFSF